MSLPRALVCEVPWSALIRGTFPQTSDCRMEPTTNGPITPNDGMSIFSGICPSFSLTVC